MINLLNLVTEHSDNIISIFALLISIISLSFTWSSARKKLIPFLYPDKAIFSKLEHNIDCSFQLEPNTTEPCCILDSRSFKISKQGILPSVYSLILDSRPTLNARTEDYKSWCNFTTVTLRNTGFDLMSIELLKTIVTYSSTKKLVLFPHKHNLLHCHLASGSSIDLHISYIFQNDAFALLNPNALLNTKKIKEGISELSPASNNLFNCQVSTIFDNYKKIEYFIRVTNIYGKKYKQKIIFYIDNNRYMATAEKQSLF